MVHIDVDVAEYVIFLKRKFTNEELLKIQKDLNFTFTIACGIDLVVDSVIIGHDILNQYVVLDNNAQYPTYESNLLSHYNDEMFKCKIEGMIERRVEDPETDQLWNDIMYGKKEPTIDDYNKFKYEFVPIEDVELDFNDKILQYLSGTQFNFDRFGKEKLEALLNHELIKNNIQGHHHRVRSTTI
jgi:hypothetical protein